MSRQFRRPPSGWLALRAIGIDRPARGRVELRHSREWLLTTGDEPPLASHLVSPRTLYCHHGVYVGNGRVIHYAGFANGWQYGPIQEVSLEDFAYGHSIRVRCDTPRFDSCEVVKRARSRLGENRYRFLTNNCEHFSEWALRGESRSVQIERLRVRPCAAAWRAVCRVCLLIGGAIGSVLPWLGHARS